MNVRSFQINERVELESLLQQHPDLQTAVVTSYEIEKTKRQWVAYVVAEPHLEKESFGAWLQQNAPGVQLYFLEKLPLTNSGEVDLTALPVPTLTRSPQSETEKKIAVVWSEFFEQEEIDVYEDFFELGGDDELAEEFHFYLQNMFQLSLPVELVKEAPTIDQLAQRIEAIQASDISSEEEKSTVSEMVIERADQDHFPMSSAQRRLWFFEKFQPNTSVYHIPFALHLTGELQVQMIKQSLQLMIDRHESLRTTFTERNGEPVQIIADQMELPFIIEDRSAEVAPKEIVLQRIKQEVDIPFDLENGPLLRAHLFRLASAEWVLLLTTHHIVSDGWSMGILIQELFSIYESLRRGEAPQLPELSWQYVDYTLWQTKWLADQVQEEQLAYWKEQLRDLPVLQLPTDRQRPAQQTYHGSIHTIRLPLQLTEQLHSFSQSVGSSLYMTLLAGFQTLLSRYTGQEDLAVGSPIAGRNRQELEGIIGFFINTLVFRTDLSGNPSFRELVERVREVALQAYAHQDVPFEQVVDELHPERSLSYSPLFQVLFTLQNMPLSMGKHGDLLVEPLSVQQEVAKFDLTLTMAEGAEGLVATFEYNTDLFDHQTIERMANHFQQILQGAMAHPEQPIGLIPILSSAEQKQLQSWNDEAKVVYPREESVADLFAQQVMKTPDQIALVFGDQHLTYDQLNRQANQLAHFLRQQGVGVDTLVGVAMERSLESIVAFLGIAKAGAAYVPLDPSYPQERLSYMVKDAQVQLIITQSHLAARWAEEEISVWSLDSLKAEISLESEENPPSIATGDDLVYVMYTSGSTGKPKGVEVVHRGIVRLVCGANYAHFSAEEVFLQLAPLAFDASTLEIWGSLLHGAKLVIMPPEQPSLEEIAQTIVQFRVTTLWLTAGLFQLMVEEQLESLLGLRQLLVGGDIVSTTHVKKLLERSQGKVQIINGYGPTENTTFTCCYPIPQDWQGSSSLPIGRPISNTEVYILDRYGQPVPIGVPGELYAGGDGLARGYHRRPELTAERFIQHPFATDPQARLYRTGDLVRMLPDGQLEFLGRIDQQVKVRGFRIELGEIEAVLHQHPLVKEAAVIVREDQPGDKRLVAYLVYQETTEKTIDWRSYLQASLPEYMVPFAYVVLEKLPLNPNGKVDRRALPAPEISAFEEHTEGFRTPIEEMIAGIWCEVLRYSPISRERNFFDLGGNSLLATQVVSRINQVFPIQLSLRTLFENPTVAQLAPMVEQLLRGDQSITTNKLQPVTTPDGRIPLSYAQQRLWFLDRLLSDKAAYNIPFALRIKGEVNLPALRQSWQELLMRHESLRTVCREVDGQGVFEVMKLSEDWWQETDLSEEGTAEMIARQWMDQDATQPFDLQQGPLVRVNFFRLAPAESLFYLNLHHIIADGWSLEILANELFTLYEAKAAGQPKVLPALPIQYSDYACWQREQMLEQCWESQLSYWKQQLNGVPVLQLPTDFPRSHEQTFAGATHHVTYSSQLAEKLERLSQQHGVTLFMTLLAAVSILLSRYSRQEDLAVGSPIAGRNIPEVEGLVGLFVNTLVYRTDLSGNPSFRELLKRVREVALGAYAHQDLPFEKIVDELQPQRSLSHSPLFQVMFALQNLGGSIPEVADLTLETVELTHQTAKFDLTIQVAESEDGLVVAWEYNRQLFAESTIARMADQFGLLLEGIVRDPEQPISEISILTEMEQQLFAQWNQTDMSFPQSTLICDLIEQQVARRPKDVAVVSPDGTTLSYQELNSAANQIAHYLDKSGVETGSIVGVCLERSPALVVALLAIMKVGAAYLPIDPSYPAERISYMLDDAKAEIVLTVADLTNKIPVDDHVICLDTDWSQIRQERRENLNALNDLEQLAYVIYTSGSTGKPKGVAVQHHSLLNLVYWHQREYQLSFADRTTLLAGVAFDASVWEIWPTLAAGGTLYIPDEEIRLQPEALRDWLIEEQISVSFIPTPLLEQLLLLEWPREVALRKLLTGGDQLRYYPSADFPADVINHYGPTENTVVATAALVSNESAMSLPPIGRPIANTKVYVLDQHLHQVPMGVPGELYLSGESLAQGYLHRPELTAERFITHAFPTEPATRLYKTGDLVRFLPDGQLEYLGRTDQQVKIRGYRVELGEIEAVLSQHPAIKEAVVIAREDQPGEKRLVGYVVLGELPLFSVETVQHFLKQQLPEYMVPAAIVVLDALPLTANGKIDRRALPAPDWSEVIDEQREYVAPRTELEQSLAGIWQQVLRIEKVGIYDNFFALGGDSILSIQLVAKARQQGLQLTPKQIFENQTIAELAKVVGQVESAQSEQGLLTGEVPLTPIQKWFFAQEMPNRHHWNQSMMLLVNQRIQPQLVAQTLSQLQTYHDALRLRFTKENGEWRQWYSQEDQIPFRYIDLTSFSPAEQSEQIEAIAAEAQASLNLSEGPIWQAVYFDLGEKRLGRLFWVIHHLAIDGVSWRILLEDFATVFGQLQQGKPIHLPEKTTSLRQWAEQLHQYAQTDLWRQGHTEWLTPLPAIPSLPVDQPNGTNSEADTQSFTVSLSEEETASLLRIVPQKYRAQIDEVLLAALGYSLMQWTDVAQFCIHLESHGREEELVGADLSRTVGWLTSMYPVYLDLTDRSDELEVVKAVKEQVRKIPRRGLDYGILRYLAKKSATTEMLQKESPAQISFNYLGQFDQTTDQGGLFAGEAPEDHGRHAAPSAPRQHLLDIVGGVVNGQLHLTWLYSKQVYFAETIKKLADAYLRFVRSLLERATQAKVYSYTPSDFPLSALTQQELDLHLSAVEVDDVYPLAPLQEGLWFHSLVDQTAGDYVVQMKFTMEGKLDVKALIHAWQKVVEQYDILRTAVLSKGLTRPHQVVYRQVSLPFAIEDWSTLSNSEQERKLREYLKKDRHQGFQLSQAPLMRLALFQCGEEYYQFVWSYHHLILDGWSMPHIFRDLFAHYERIIVGKSPQLTPIRPYADYIALLQQQDHGKAEAFWQAKLQGFTEPTILPIEQPTTTDQEGSSYQQQIITLPKELTQLLLSVAQQYRITLNTVVQGAWAYLLSRYSGQEDVVFGATVSGRPADLPHVNQMVGLFINSLPVRVQIPRQMKVSQWLQQIQQDQLQMREYEYTPLVEIQRLSELPAGTPLFETLVVFENYPIGNVSEQLPGGLRFTEAEGIEQVSYPLTLIIAPGEQLSFKWMYDSQRFNEESIIRMSQQLETILRGIVADPEQDVGVVKLLTAAEQQQLITWNKTEQPYPMDCCLHDWVANQARRTPHQVAVIAGEKELTYRQLDQKANQLARFLQKRGVRPGVRVGILLERSLDLVISLLAVLKAGGTYVPLDPAYPEERLQYMLADSEAKVVLTQGTLRSLLTSQSVQMLAVDQERKKWQAESISPVKTIISTEQLAYLIYTSGSTGRPKGVMIAHRNAAALLQWAHSVFTPAELKGVLAATSICFDLSIFELFVPLSCGGTVILAENALQLPELSRKHQVTLINTVPSAITELLRLKGIPSSVRTVNLAGEPLSNQLAQALYQLETIEKVYNLYGPSEDTTYSTYALVEKGADRAPAIGRPIANTAAYVLDAQLRPVPVGVPGELYLSGAGLAQGYLNQEELTAERFVWHSLQSDQPIRLYKTGDIVRYRADGQLEFLGRVDHQVKIRGYRIELGEIEAVLRTHETIEDVVVMARDDLAEDKRLVAYVIAEQEESGSWRQHIKQKLPDYMIPSAFVVMEAFPLTPNGKLDRKAFPVPEADNSKEGYLVPQTVVEEMVAAIWSEVIGVQLVGREDHFFMLGGHSLLATQVVSRVQDVFQIELPLRIIFENPRLSQFAKEIEQRYRREAALLPELKPQQRSEHPLPLSYAQQRLWFLEQLQPESTAYHLPFAIRLQGSLDVVAFQQSLLALQQRHETLRTAIQQHDGEAVQVIVESQMAPVSVVDLREHQEPLVDAMAQIEEDLTRPFQLEQAPLCRMKLFQLAEEDYLFYVNLHHIISDGWSMQVLFDELIQWYRLYSQQEGAAVIPPLPIQYADYAVWQQKWLQGELLEEQLEYWRKQLADVPVLQLPTDFPRLPKQTIHGDAYRISLPTELIHSLEELGQQENATLFMTLMAAFQVLLSRYSGQMDFAIGSPIAGRNQTETEKLIGFFVNTLAIRADLTGDPSFRELLGRVRETVLTAFAKQDVPFEKVVDELQPDRSLSHTPLFQVMFALQNMPTGKQTFANLNVESVELPIKTAKFDLTLTMGEEKQGFMAVFEYNTDLFSQETIKRLAQHFHQLLKVIVQQPEERVAKLPLLTETEQTQLSMWNQTAMEYPTDRLAHEWFTLRARLMPKAIAVIDGERELTYGELNRRANQLAHHLQKRGIKVGDRVGICLERSFELIVSILGALKAGATYVPLDPDNPRERLQYVCNDAELAAFLTTRAIQAETMFALDVPLLYLDEANHLLAAEKDCEPEVTLSVDAYAYLIYTSGSTGRPKGVPITHRSLLNLLFWHIREYQLTRNDRTTLLAGVAFDASVWEIWPTLATGAALVIAPEEVRISPEKLRDWLIDQEITISFLPTPLLESILPLSWPKQVALRKLLTGGDQLHLYPPADFPVDVINHYGPTENTVVTTTYAVPRGEGGYPLPPIGRPIANTEVYVLDSQLQPVPIGVPGELYIGGAGVTDGYHRRAELTAERFIPHPFRPGSEHRLYQTGDLVRYLPDGHLEYLGRIDQQVQIRGFRVELGEIESLLSQHPAVKEVVVIAKEEQTGNKQLVAYLVLEEGANEVEWVTYLAQYLPEYMIPSVFLQIETIPLTANGKIDRRALPEPFTLDDQNENQPPQTASEIVIAKIWSSLLSKTRIFRQDNFFALGGHSLLATQVISRINEAFGVELPLRTIFEAPSLELLAKQVDQQQLEHELAVPPLTPQKRNGMIIPASYAQRRLWFLNSLLEQPSVYNIPFAIRIRGKIDVPSLQQSFLQLIERHESLRTVFTDKDGQVMQVIQDTIPAFFTVVDLIDDPAAEETAQTDIQKDVETAFDLEKGPLVRASLYKIAENHAILAVNLHHIIADGWSMSVLLKELFAGYQARARKESIVLPDMQIQYADFALWQQERLQGDFLQRQIDYWKEQLNGVPVLQLPTDHPRLPEQTFRGDTYQLPLSAELGERLKKISQQMGTTLFMTLLAGFQVLLYRYTGQEDLAVGSPIAGRNHQEVENLIGFFINTLVFRTDLSGQPSFRELLSRVREVTLGAYAHQDIPFEKVVDEVAPDRHLSHSPLFQVMFSMQNTPREWQAVDGWHMETLPIEQATSKFDLTVTMAEAEDGLLAAFEYNTDLYNRETIQRMAEQFTLVLEQLVAQPEIPISQVKMLTPTEEELLAQWNQTKADFRQDRLITEWVEMQAIARPTAYAVVSPTERLTYQELNNKANQLANALRKKGVDQETLVAICCDRSPDYLVGILAVLKAGGAYVPIDPAYPVDRITYMLQDSRAKLVLSQSHLATKLTTSETSLICLDRDRHLWSGERTDNLPTEARVDQLCYVIYTSGSTGKPKGVMITHRSLLNLVCWHQREYQLTENDRTTILAGMAFDASVWEIWPTLASGATLYIPTEEQRLSPEALRDWLIDKQITVSFLPTPLLESLLQIDWPKQVPLRTLLTGGDQLRSYPTREFPCEVVNHYGPTENTVVSTAMTVPKGVKWKRMPAIGRPIANTEVYVLDANHQQVPIGVAGELYVGGVGLARGYFGRPDLTEASFIPHPYSQKQTDRLYKTGDLVRFLPDGTLEFLGRIDQQVKIRGFRVELGEIETAIQSHPTIQECVVIAREDEPGQKRLVAYLVTQDETSFQVSDLRQLLKQQLPEYMIPSAFVQMDTIPLTANGKVDRQSLPRPTASDSVDSDAFVEARNRIEGQLVTIWKQVLRLDRVGIHDNFFQLGGDSIISLQVVARAKQKGLSLTPKQIFEHQTIAELATVVGQGEIIEAEQGLVTGEVPFTPIQHWFLGHNLAHPDHWNQSMFFEMTKSLHPDLLKQALQALKTHHDVLRLRFQQRGAQWIQAHAELDEIVPLHYIDLSEHPEAEQTRQMEEIAQSLQSHLDLSSGPLWQVAYFHLGSARPDCLLWVAHHLLVDGVSWRILLEDLQLAYEQLSKGKTVQLPAKTTSFKQWATKLQAYAQTEEVTSQVSYWQKQLQSPLASLPPDQPDGRNREGAVASKVLTLTETETTQLLQKAPEKYHAGLNELLLTSLALAVSRWTREQALLIHLEGHGREEVVSGVDLSRTVGWFTSIYPVRLEVGDLRNRGEALRLVKEQLRKIPQNGIGYGLIQYLSETNGWQQLQVNSGAEISFNYLGQFDSITAGDSLFQGEPSVFAGFPIHPDNKRPHLIDVVGAVRDRKLHLSWLYSKELFFEETITRVANDFVDILRSFIQVDSPEEQSIYVPSDFPEADLSEQDLSKVLTLLKKRSR